MKSVISRVQAPYEYPGEIQVVGLRRAEDIPLRKMLCECGRSSLLWPIKLCLLHQLGNDFLSDTVSSL